MISLIIMIMTSRANNTMVKEMRRECERTKQNCFHHSTAKFPISHCLMRPAGNVLNVFFLQAFNSDSIKMSSVQLERLANFERFNSFPSGVINNIIVIVVSTLGEILSQRLQRWVCFFNSDRCSSTEQELRRYFRMKAENVWKRMNRSTKAMIECGMLMWSD